MDQRNLTEQCEIIAQALLRDLPKGDEHFNAAVRAGIVIATELLLDIKRIAEAAGPPIHLHFHCPEGSVLNAVGDSVRIEPWSPPAETPSLDGERLARFLAKKKVAQLTDPFDEATSQAWVDANWRMFQDQAAELLAAALPGAGK